MRFLCLALLGIALVSANVRLRQSRHARPDDDMAAPLSEQTPPLHDWLTAEQKAILEPIRENPAQFKEKVQEFYKLLDGETRKKWDENYRQECNSWLPKVLSSQELADLKLLETTDKAAAKDKRKEYESRLDDKSKNMVTLWRDECDKLNEASRKRRELNELDDDSVQLVFEAYSRVSRNAEPADDFISWMSDDQKKQMGELKAAGKSLSEQRDKAMAFFNALPDDKRKELRESYKGKCKAYFGKIGTPEELAEIKQAHEAGNGVEVDEKIQALIGRQEGEEKVTASKMSSICREVFQGDKKKKRDVMQKIEKHLSWLTKEQQDEIKGMVDSGVPRHEIKEKLFKYLSNTDALDKNKAKEETTKRCYAWMEEVATKEEIESLHKLHEVDHDACKTKVREYIKRLPTDKQAKVNEDLPFCEKVWYGSHDHGNHGDHGDHANHEKHHKHHARNVQRRRRHLAVIEEYIHWLSPEDKEAVHAMENSGADFDEIIEKIKEIFKAQPEDRQEELKENFKNTCYKWVKEVGTPEELAELKALKESGDFTQLKEKVALLETKLDSAQKHTVEHTKELCYSVWQVKQSRMRREHSHNLEEAFGKYLSWTTDEQKEELRKLREAGNREDLYKKVMEFFDATEGETKQKAAGELKDACKHFAVDLFGEAGVEQIKTLKESGGSQDDIAAKVQSLVDSITDGEKKEKAQKFTAACGKIYRSVNRKRRDHSHHLKEAFDKYLTWTTEEQKKELTALEESGDKDGIQKKVLEFFDATEGETKQKAAAELKDACKHFAMDLFGEAGVAEIKAVKEAGGSHDDMAAKVQTLVDAITDAEKKEKAQKLSAGCAKVYRSVNRKRRDHAHNLKDAFDKYLTWTTEEQKKELTALEESGDKDAIQKKVMEFFDATEGETKQKAAAELKDACKHFAVDLFGEAGVAEIKAVKEAGGSPDDMAAKVQTLVDAITDAEKKEKAQKLSAGCAKVYRSVNRKRRDHAHNLKDAFDKYLTWTTEEQKKELTALEESGDKDAIQKKVMEFFDATEGETKQKAAAELKDACKHFAVDLFGEAGVAEIKAVKEAGGSHDDMAAKVQTLVDAITDAEKKEKAQKLSAGCAKVYRSVNRKRRDHAHNLKDAFDKYLTWTTEEQKKELTALEESGDKDGIQKKVMEFFDATEGETKQKAAAELKDACKHFAVDLFGEAGVAEIKAVKEAGGSPDDMAAKVQTLVDAITDAEKKEKAQKLSAGCAKVYRSVNRKRRDHAHNLKDAFDKYLTWTTEEQKKELTALEESGDKDGIQKKVMEFFDATEGETKQKAAAELKDACKHFAVDLFGEAGVAEIKAVKEAGGSPDDMAAKVQTLVDAITDAEKKEKAQKLSAGCAKIYRSVNRKRRDHPHTLKDAFEKYLTWTTEEQKKELTALEESGNKDGIEKKIMEFFEATEGEVKQKAVGELKEACKHYATDVFGEAGIAEIKAVRESGGSHDDIAAKVQTLVDAITDAEKKTKAQKLSVTCGKLYREHSRKRRDHHHSLEDFVEKYLGWTTEEQKNELRDLKTKSEDKEAIYKKVMEFFDAAEGDTKQKAAEGLKGACKHYATDLFGEEGVEQIKAVKESGADKGAMLAKIQELINGLSDETKKAKAQKLTAGCQKVYEAIPSRMRRSHDHDMEKEMEKYLSWLTVEQKAELGKIDKSDKKALREKIWEFLDSVDGKTKAKAVTDLKAACKHYSVDIFGEEKTAELKNMKESGVSIEDLMKKLTGFIEELSDDATKEKAKDLVEGCKKVYEQTRMRRDSYY